jgi:hypothetical protein
VLCHIDKTVVAVFDGGGEGSLNRQAVGRGDDHRAIFAYASLGAADEAGKFCKSFAITSTVDPVQSCTVFTPISWLSFSGFEYNKLLLVSVAADDVLG